MTENINLRYVEAVTFVMLLVVLLVVEVELHKNEIFQVQIQAHCVVK